MPHSRARSIAALPVSWPALLAWAAGFLLAVAAAHAQGVVATTPGAPAIAASVGGTPGIGTPGIGAAQIVVGHGGGPTIIRPPPLEPPAIGQQNRAEAAHDRASRKEADARAAPPQ